MKYQEFKKHQKVALNEFVENKMFFAFNNEQFEEGKKKLSVSEENKIIDLGAGCFLLSKYLNEYIQFIENQKKERKEFVKNQKKEIEDAIMFELFNHECIYSYDLEEDFKTISRKIFDNEQKKNLVKIAKVYYQKYRPYVIEHDMI